MFKLTPAKSLIYYLLMEQKNQIKGKINKNQFRPIPEDELFEKEQKREELKYN